MKKLVGALLILLVLAFTSAVALADPWGVPSTDTSLKPPVVTCVPK